MKALEIQQAQAAVALREIWRKSGAQQWLAYLRRMKIM
jgi:hypothetical protein